MQNDSSQSPLAELGPKFITTKMRILSIVETLPLIENTAIIDNEVLATLNSIAFESLSVNRFMEVTDD